MVTLQDNEIPHEIAKEIISFFSSSPSCQLRILRVIFVFLKRLNLDTRDRIIDRLSHVCGIELLPRWDERAMLSWDEVREMSTNGISFGAHTVNHPVLADISLEEARREILESKKTIENKIQKTVKTFA